MKARGFVKKLLVLLCAFATLAAGADFRSLAISSEGEASSNSEEASPQQGEQQEPDAPDLLEGM